jgi:hypothetical protein
MNGASEGKKQSKDQRLNRRNLILSFVLPFLAFNCIWTVIDYCDISDGLEHERDVGVKHRITEQEILVDSLKKSLLLAVPAGLIGLAVGLFCFKKNDKQDDSVQ